MNQNDLIMAQDSGIRRVRDHVIASLIGLQNEIGNDENSIEYKAYQKLMNVVEDKWGSFMSRQTSSIKRCEDCDNPCEIQANGCGCKPITK